jgi:hypothetical protein
LLPHLGLVVVDRIESAPEDVTLFVRADVESAACTRCRRRSARVHGVYRRSLADCPLAGRRVRIVLRVRRFKCGNPRCDQRTFSEQIAGLTTPFARRTPALTDALVSIALAAAGRAGSRWACELGMPTCRDVMIRLIRAQPVPEPPEVTPLAAPTGSSDDCVALEIQKSNEDGVSALVTARVGGILITFYTAIRGKAPVTITPDQVTAAVNGLHAVGL